MNKTLKYSKEQMADFMAYAKEHNVGVLKMLEHFKINRRTFYMTAHRYGMNTDAIRTGKSFNTRAMSKEQVDQILEKAKANRISHKEACKDLGFSYNTFRGAIVRLGIKAERFSSTYSKEDVEKTFDYAKEQHISLSKACQHFGFEYHLLSPTAKRYKLKLERDLPIFPEANAMSDKDVVALYLGKGYVANEIFHVFKKLGRNVLRGMVYYYCKEQSPERVQTKVQKLKERLAKLESSPAGKI